jgi:hypothetical protein
VSKSPVTSMEYARSLMDVAKTEFAFLIAQGFQLTDQKAPTSTSALDGFYLRYSRNPVDLVVKYYDMELQPIFQRGSTQIDYFFADRYMFENTSGYAGAMFPLDKLADALRVVASDIRDHYRLVLSGDDSSWKKLIALLSAPQTKRGLP